MKKEQKVSIDDHKKFMDENVQYLLKPLMVDILKNRPGNVLDYIVEWCQTKGSQIQKNATTAKIAAVEEQPAEILAKEEIIKSIREFKEQTPSDLPSSENEEDDVMPDAPDQFGENGQVSGKPKTHKKKMAISAEVYGVYNTAQEFKPPIIEKSEEQQLKISEILKMNFMFSQLEESDLKIVIKAMSVRTYEEGDVVIKQGDDGAELFIVGAGTLVCTKLFEGQEEETFLKKYQTGEMFGELALMHNAPRAATIKSEKESTLFSLDRDTFNHIIKSATIKRRETYEEFLRKVDILSNLQEYERAKLCDCLKSETFKKDDVVIKEGEPGEKFYLIQSGTAKATKKQDDGSESVVFEYGENDYFGELALINNDPRKASIVVTSDKLLVASLDSKSFKRLLGPTEEILKRSSSKYEKYIKAN